MVDDFLMADPCADLGTRCPKKFVLYPFVLLRKYLLAFVG